MLIKYPTFIQKHPDH